MPVHFSKPATMFTLEDAKGIVLSDFGAAFRPNTPDERLCLGKDSGIPLHARAPEALFAPYEPLSFASDIWSLACAIWHVQFGMCSASVHYAHQARQELITWQLVSSKFWRRRSFLSPDSKYGCAMTRCLGVPLSGDSPSLPKRPHDIDEDPEPPINPLFEERVQQRRWGEGKPFEEAETVAILDLMKGMLRLGPNERWTVGQVLESEWMKNWALPALNGAVVSKPLDDPFR
jgi:serine/threonine protein kinase